MEESLDRLGGVWDIGRCSTRVSAGFDPENRVQLGTARQHIKGS